MKKYHFFHDTICSFSKKKLNLINLITLRNISLNTGSITTSLTIPGKMLSEALACTGCIDCQCPFQIFAIFPPNIHNIFAEQLRQDQLKQKNGSQYNTVKELLPDLMKPYDKWPRPLILSYTDISAFHISFIMANLAGTIKSEIGPSLGAFCQQPEHVERT